MFYMFARLWGIVVSLLFWGFRERNQPFMQWINKKYLDLSPMTAWFFWAVRQVVSKLRSALAGTDRQRFFR